MIVYFTCKDSDNMECGELLTAPYVVRQSVGGEGCESGPYVDIKRVDGRVFKGIELENVCGVQDKLVSIYFPGITRYNDPVIDGNERLGIATETFEKFLDWMVKEMRMNRYKGDKWRSCMPHVLILELYKHCAKVHQDVLKTENIETVKEHCADVANLAYMIINQYMGYEKQRRPGEVTDEYGILGSE